MTDDDLPLAGVKVLDLTTTLYGPCTTQILGDFGADVIKIEPPAGDPVRDVGPSRNDGMASIFLGCNRNKRGIVLDLKRETGKRALWRLIESAEMFIHNMRPHKISELGFSSEVVMQRHPGIVYGGLHGYREAGPYGKRPAYDDVIQGESGIAGLFTERDGTPALVPAAMADKNAAYIAAGGLVAAYVKRLRTGKGVYLECTMFEGLVSYNLIEHQYGATFKPPIGDSGYPRALSANRRPHQTRDGYLCLLAYTDRQWQSFWQLAGTPDVADDPRFKTIGDRSRNIDALYDLAGRIMTSRDTHEWLRLLEDAQIPAGPVNSLDDVLQDKHLQNIGFFRDVVHPSEGELMIPDTPYLFDQQSLPVRRHQPQLGEHTREVLLEIGMNDEEIDKIVG